MIKKYKKSTFFAFDELLTFLLSEVHFPVSMNYFDALFSPIQKQVPRFGENQRILFEGIPGVTNIQIGFYPVKIIKRLFENYWPDEYELEFEPLIKNEKQKYQLNSKMTYSVQVLGGCFSQFWDKAVPLIEAKFGTDQQKWPPLMNFGRVIRNSFSHGNKIFFLNSKAASVTWKNLVYSPSENGRVVLFQDMGIADFIILFEEICVALI